MIHVTMATMLALLTGPLSSADRMSMDDIWQGTSRASEKGVRWARRAEAEFFKWMN